MTFSKKQSNHGAHYHLVNELLLNEEQFVYNFRQTKELCDVLRLVDWLQQVLTYTLSGLFGDVGHDETCANYR